MKGKDLMKELPDIALKIDVDSVDIYALVDPITKKVKYIGQTFSVKSRYVAHLSQNSKLRNWQLPFWVRRLEKMGLRPELYLLEVVKHQEGNEREEFWINYFGFDNLLNQMKRHRGPKSSLYENWERSKRIINKNRSGSGTRPDEVIAIR